MNRKSWILITLVLLTLASLACSLIPQTGAPTGTAQPAATNTPRPTATALPPKPVVPYTPVPADMLSPIIVQRNPKRGERTRA